jgi:hypothetical protein
MYAKFILIAVACMLLAASGLRFARTGRLDSASRTWLLVTLIFAIVSGWLWWSEIHR